MVDGDETVGTLDWNHRGRFQLTVLGGGLWLVGCRSFLNTDTCVVGQQPLDAHGCISVGGEGPVDNGQSLVVGERSWHDLMRRRMDRMRMCNSVVVRCARVFVN